MRIPQSGQRIDNPAWPLLAGLISYWGITDANGSALGITLVCGQLANEPSYDGLQVKILSGPASGQVRTIAVHAGNTLTVGAAFTNPAGAVQQITAGTLFVILSVSGGGGGPGPAPPEGLSYYGVVDAVPGANQFTIGGLAGLGAGKFDGATNPYSVFVLRDAGGAGAAPQGELQAVTAYVAATGTFTAVGFGGGGVAIGDEILIVNPGIANAIIGFLLLNVPLPDAVANITATDVIGNKASTPIYAPTNTADIIRYLKGINNSAGLVYKGTVTNAVNTTQFAALDLAGFGDQAFANGQYFIFAFRDVGGAAAMPQSEFRLLQTYTSVTGMFTHEAFSVDLANGDTILVIHQSLLFPGAVSGFGVFDTSSTTVPADSTRAARYNWEVADQFKGMLLMPLMGACRFIARRIVGFTVAGGIFTLDPSNPFPGLPGNAEYLILEDQTEFVPVANSAVNAMPSDVIGNKSDAAVIAVGVVASIIAYAKGILNSINTTGVLVGSYAAAAKKLAGVPQNFTKNITSAANAGDVVVATITTQPCFIKRIVLRSNGATTADLTNAAIYGGAGKVVTFIDSVTGLRVNIAAADQQVFWTGAASFAATKTIVITLTGTGATAVNFQVDIEYYAIADGGYLV